MFVIKRIIDPRMSSRVCRSFDLPEGQGFAYGAYKDEEVLATAVFCTEKGGVVVFCGVDTGRRMDIDLCDGMLRAALFAQKRCGAKSGRLGETLPEEVRRGLNKLGYPERDAFSLSELFEKKCDKR